MTEPNHLDHLPNEASPGEVHVPPAPPVPAFGLHDSSWSGDQWFQLLKSLIDSGVATWKDVTALFLGHLNPPQVGTSLASSDGFKARYGKGNTMRVVMDWVYNQTGRCADCGSRLELQADHVVGREEFIRQSQSPLDADYIENMTLRCRRCNVVKRESHKLGGLTYLTAEAALMWILLVIRPRTLEDFKRMCRVYGMTMADIRMQEAWAMAHWLAKAEPPAYGIEDEEHGRYDLIQWTDSAITRVEAGREIPPGVARIHTQVSGLAIFGFCTTDQTDVRLRFHEQPIAFIPFSTYNLGAREPQALCISYSSPDREGGEPSPLQMLSPRGSTLLCHAVRMPHQIFKLTSNKDPKAAGTVLAAARYYGRLQPTKLQPVDCQIISVDPAS